MAWIDNYRQAKFRTANFYVPNSENSGGRRGVVHEFPKRDLPYVEDMGRKARSFQLDAYVLGEDYFTLRDNLITALEKEGVGKLVHPYFGTLDVLCTNYSVRETVSEGRIARFTLTFVESGILKYPNTIIDTTSDVAIKKSIAITDNQVFLVENYDIVSSPYSVSQNAVSTIEKGLESVENAKKTVSAVSEFRKQVDYIQNNIIQLAYSPIDLAQEFSNLITFGTNIFNSFSVTIQNAVEQFREMRKLFDFIPDDVLASVSPSQEFSKFIQQSSVINALGLLSIINYSSLDEAVEFRNIVFDKVEQILLTTEDDALYTSLYNLETAVSRDIDERARQLPRLVSHFINASLPVINVSYDLYGTISEEQDIIDRNKINHPLFAPGGVPIEVKIYA
jgi:prophage DNA circulation protein